MRYLTAGESHGKALVGIMDGVPSGIKIDFAFIDGELKRRQAGYGRGDRMKIERDAAEFLSGVRNGATTGSPVSVLIKNRDFENWTDVMGAETADTGKRTLTAVRPGHADLAGCVKYKKKDARDILERASARNTAVTVALGAAAKCFLRMLGVDIASGVTEIGGVSGKADYTFSELSESDKSPVRCPDAEASEKMTARIDAAKAAGDTVGGEFLLKARGVKTGVGSHTQADLRLDFAVAAAIGGLQGVKSVEIGAGKRFSAVSGTEIHDEMFFDGEKIFRKTNNAGGIEGGISNGEEIVVRAVFKPIPTTMKGLRTVDIVTLAPAVSGKERSDVCAVPAAAVVAESLLALTLMKEILVYTGGSDMETIIKRWDAL